MDDTKKNPPPAETSWSRRKFLGAASTAAAGLMVVPRHVVGATQQRKAPSDTLNIACVGVGGMGFRTPAASVRRTSSPSATSTTR